MVDGVTTLATIGDIIFPKVQLTFDWYVIYILYQSW